ncbi:MAG: PIN domain-containing protein [Raoultibacter sp.]
MNLLLDTNILIDYLGRKDPYYADAKKLFVMQVFGDADLWVCAQSFTDAFYVLQKYVTSEQLQAAFEKILERINVCSLGENDIRSAAAARWPDFEDCLIAVCAQKIKADYIVTRDEKGFSASVVPAIRPADLVSQQQASKGFAYDEIDFSE